VTEAWGQRQGWIQLGDLAFAYVFPVRLSEPAETEPEQEAAV
jgi:hypothetical protein